MNKQVKRRIRSMAWIAILFAGLLTLCACEKGKDKENKDSPAETQTNTVSDITIETKYATLHYPVKYEGKLTHKEVLQDNIAVEIFTAVVGDAERELFRIYFNDESMGAHVGYIVRGREEIPVSYYVCEYEDEIFATELIKEEYYSLMDAFEAIMNSVYENTQFSQDKTLEPVENQMASLTYWEVTIPENVYWEEYESGETYRADFYGIIQDTRVDLYSIGLGGMDADYSVGTFLVDGDARKIQVRIYEVPENHEWEDEDYSAVYRMLESVNTVIDTILTDERYAESVIPEV